MDNKIKMHDTDDTDDEQESRMSSLTVRMDEEIKGMFMGFCKGTGLTMSAAINIFARACIRQKRIPIDITNGGSWIAPQAQRLGRPR